MDTSWYYQRELEQLRVLAKEFAKEHPSIAPLLAGSSSDPDIERLLEGCAYINAQLTQKLEDSYNRIAENLTSLVMPQLLHSIPSCTVLNFLPKRSLRNKQNIPKGSRIGSKEVDNVSCVFSTSYAIDLYPMELESVNSETRPGQPNQLQVTLLLTKDNALKDVDSLRFYLTGDTQKAFNRLYALLFHVSHVTVSLGDETFELPSDVIRPVGFDSKEALFPYPSTAWSGYQLLQEYYVFPEKFLFLEIGLPLIEKKTKELDQLNITFYFQNKLKEIPSFDKGDFALFATPAINVFPFETVPIKMDYKTTSYPIRANTSNSSNYIPYQVKEVIGVHAEDGEREYTPVLTARFDERKPHYVLQYPKNAKGEREIRISPLFPPKNGVPNEEVLSLDVLYSNGNLPQALNVGDVNVPLSTSPALANFSNITVPTSSVQVPIEGDTYWSFLAHLHLNYLPLANADTLKAILLTYLPPQSSATLVSANKYRIDAILELNVADVDFVWKGFPVKGSEITVILNNDGFTNIGELGIFGMVITKFIHYYSPINSFVSVTVKDTLNQMALKWNNHEQKPFLL